MKKIRSLLTSFWIKVTLALIFSMLLVGAMSNFLIYKFTLDSQFNELRDKLKVIVQSAALLIDADTLAGIPLNRQGVNSPQYKTIVEQLRKIKAANPPIKYIYIMSKTDKEGIWQFVVDPDPIVVNKKKQRLTAYPGDAYDVRRFPEMLNAFNWPAADKKLESDQWGVSLSGYAPIRDKDGKAVAALGIDIAANQVYMLQRQVNKRALLVLACGIILSLVLGILVSKRITGPIRRLVEGTRRIGAGDLQYRVEISGNDEISELASSFNEMAKSLSETRKKLLGYFYDVVQSMVRVLEAKDHYTRGHSERVAGYAARVAAKMGFSAEKIELLTEMALLHDIGKLSIKDNILNKKGQLTDEEWEEIRKHPLIGEDILRPVILDEEMLAMVREHHERYDGKGYPDRLSGDKINIFAAILTVADAFDAMTSERSYRPALSKQDAAAELKAKSGTQFNPKVVETFIEILKDEKNQLRRF
ncbi:MAG: HD domain-containing protein [Candidatus Omnitrophica bacterium]|nr:HD domain-containing protein [Candidatus Omnitrophota bacterium]